MGGQGSQVGGGGRVQGGCDRRSEAFVKIHKKNIFYFFFWGGGAVGGGDVGLGGGWSEWM